MVQFPVSVSYFQFPLSGSLARKVAAYALHLLVAFNSLSRDHQAQ
jgi:hypothetical protein